MPIFTFVCRTAEDLSYAVDLQSLTTSDARLHALRLLDDHLSSARVEIWRDDRMEQIVERPTLNFGETHQVSRS